MSSVLPLRECPYGKMCYRKNPLHHAEYSHPPRGPAGPVKKLEKVLAAPKKDRNPLMWTGERGRSELVKAPDGRPICKFGAACGRRSEFHLTTYYHPEREEQIRSETDEKLKRRHVVFVGNLPQNVTKEQVAEHFAAAAPVSIRLVSMKGQEKGCGFVEFEGEANLNKAIRLHHSTMGGRVINVERTAAGGGSGGGGGGGGAQRTQKTDETLASETKVLHRTKLTPSPNPSAPITDRESAQTTHDLHGSVAWRAITLAFAISGDVGEHRESLDLLTAMSGSTAAHEAATI